MAAGCDDELGRSATRIRLGEDGELRTGAPDCGWDFLRDAEGLLVFG